ncbi:isopeptide-forming domain-containing fimbrial protein [Arcanobacterium haemolyticum]|uniref:LPXTG-motif cell wall anchor domain protein n=1 Tax=Arcanobacterium haemolyticum (strain ATCC 9345 / DSM 20595 / CCM 5947 / CCUG 17215 / LMG 16163 / NBRC 15585 / NCTC 8452 / 11018) TaxID=644284 RepID=D7BLJ9_ARCHD|nr:SpaH/EbpB family LPXTG-anchored major pilin [Arcanobacterium haemolyticum]ADH91798.1 LPXTG-motif cell wall anchor domain protein [Arcanobacterium haemolyticum DSM 20595]QCX46001.1 isopeptide-forming domain-containing fimbrial protein [Arcanobacterium haemolyticum]SQH27382.1 Fimbrial subunit type 1 precursor [Arcanobacterium haemolyticum]
MSRNFKRSVALLATTTLAFVGLGVSAAVAETNSQRSSAEVVNIDKEKEGSLTIHKKAVDKEEDIKKPNPDEKDALEGVTFEIRKINDIDLSKIEGWQKVADLKAEKIDLDAVEKLGLTPIKSDKTNINGEVKFDNLKIGAYLVTEKSIGSRYIKKISEPFVVTIPQPKKDVALGSPKKTDGWNYDVVAYPKNVWSKATPLSKKATAIEGLQIGGTIDQPGIVKNYQKGVVVTWDLEYVIPELAEYREFEISDKLPGGAKLIDADIKMDGAIPLTSYYTRTTDNNLVKYVFTPEGLAKLKAGQKITVKVKTKLQPGNGSIKNEGNVNINGNKIPGQDIVNFRNVELTKQDSASKEKLAGAEFDIYQDVDNDSKVTDTDRKIGQLIVPAGGVARFTTYIGRGEAKEMNLLVKETHAPKGYLLPSDAVTPVKISSLNETDPVKIAIDNYKPIVPGLPLTGATGILVLTLAGGAMILLGVFAVYKARSRKAA